MRGSDPLFNKYKDLAQDQSWLKEIGGPSHKKWYLVTETKHREPKTKMLSSFHCTRNFGFSHDRKLADEAGCEYGPTYTGRANWGRICILVFKVTLWVCWLVFAGHGCSYILDMLWPPIFSMRACACILFLLIVGVTQLARCRQVQMAASRTVSKPLILDIREKTSRFSQGIFQSLSRIQQWRLSTRACTIRTEEGQYRNSWGPLPVWKHSTQNAWLLVDVCSTYCFRGYPGAFI